MMPEGAGSRRGQAELTPHSIQAERSIKVRSQGKSTIPAPGRSDMARIGENLWRRPQSQALHNGGKQAGCS